MSDGSAKIKAELASGGQIIIHRGDDGELAVELFDGKASVEVSITLDELSDFIALVDADWSVLDPECDPDA